MPDGDRFERKLRGKGWRSVYRLGCSSAPINAVADKVMGAAVHVLRTESIECVRGCYMELREAARRLEPPLFRESASHDAFDQLNSGVEALQADEGFSENARLAADAARRTFNEVDQPGEIPGDDALAQRFTTNFVSALTERRCLSPVRDGVMQSSGRTKEEQANWEAELKRSIAQPCGPLSKSLLGGDRARSTRAPGRLFKPAPVTLETLNQPLPVLGEQR